MVRINIIACVLLLATQASWRDPEAWGVFAGSVAAVDQQHHTLDVVVRSGTYSAPKQWTEDKQFAFSDLQLKVRQEPVRLQLSFTEATKVWKVTNSRLEPQSQPVAQIESGSPVLIELGKDQHWSTKRTSPTSAQDLVIARIVMLQACIEESCSKAQCKGKADCKEKVCDCPKPK